MTSQCVCRRAFAATTVVVALSLPLAALAADTLFDTYFATQANGAACYGRTYDDAHLKEHPAQTVQRIEIDSEKAISDGKLNSAERFELGFAILLKSSPEWYGQNAICKTSATAMECYLEGDGGLFKLTPAEDGGLKLETGDYGIAVEGSHDSLQLSGKDGDDRVFLLNPSRDECDAAAASFKDGSE